MSEYIIDEAIDSDNLNDEEDDDLIEIDDNDDFINDQTEFLEQGR